jgi:hypothetical protein
MHGKTTLQKLFFVISMIYHFILWLVIIAFGTGFLLNAVMLFIPEGVKYRTAFASYALTIALSALIALITWYMIQVYYKFSFTYHKIVCFIAGLSLLAIPVHLIYQFRYEIGLYSDIFITIALIAMIIATFTLSVFFIGSIFYNLSEIWSQNKKSKKD